MAHDHRAQSSFTQNNTFYPDNNTVKELHSTIKVLLVDDNQDLADISGMLLKSMGFQAIVCYSGSKCIEIAETARPDIILLDIEMPVMDGYATCEYIRKQEWGKEMPVVAFTSLDPDFYGNRIVVAGFDNYLVKPARPEEITSVIINTITSRKQITPEHLMKSKVGQV